MLEVCCVGTSKRLRALDVPFSNLCLLETEPVFDFLPNSTEWKVIDVSELPPGKPLIPAYTLDFLKGFIPHRLYKEYELTWEGCKLFYWNGKNKYDDVSFFSLFEEEAYADMLIYLLEQRILNPEDLYF